ncbi:MAG: hypothetical protein JKY95_07890 [Planctomycetaceae bacterium]|nr:hypothetical protein [Planctomycetaceae bacterium]
MRKLILGLCCLTFVMACSLQSADARPKYYSQFKKLYPDVEGLSEKKCYICHKSGTKDKKKNNDYGIAIKGILGDAKNVKDAEAIIKALKETEAKESKTSGKTYGDLLKANKLPSNDE